jgi:hypothetical protein
MISCRWLIVVIAGAIAGEAITAMNSLNEHASNLERSVCGSLCELLAFWSFRLAAGAPDASAFQGLRWAMYCGMRACPAMEKARGWVESYGARVELSSGTRLEGTAGSTVAPSMLNPCCRCSRNLIAREDDV